MRTVEEITKRIEEIKADERMGYPTANIQVNAPLAFIQFEGEVAVAVLQWVLGERKSCANSYPTSKEE